MPSRFLPQSGHKADQHTGGHRYADCGPWIAVYVFVGNGGGFPCPFEHRLRRVGQSGLCAFQFFLELRSCQREAFARHRRRGLQQILAVVDHGPEISGHPAFGQIECVHRPIHHCRLLEISVGMKLDVDHRPSHAARSVRWHTQHGSSRLSPGASAGTHMTAQSVVSVSAHNVGGYSR